MHIVPATDLLLGAALDAPVPSDPMTTLKDKLLSAIGPADLHALGAILERVGAAMGQDLDPIRTLAGIMAGQAAAEIEEARGQEEPQATARWVVTTTPNDELQDAIKDVTTPGLADEIDAAIQQAAEESELVAPGYNLPDEEMAAFKVLHCLETAKGLDDLNATVLWRDKGWSITKVPADVNGDPTDFTTARLQGSTKVHSYTVEFDTPHTRGGIGHHLTWSFDRAALEKHMAAWTPVSDAGWARRAQQIGAVQRYMQQKVGLRGPIAQTYKTTWTQYVGSAEENDEYTEEPRSSPYHSSKRYIGDQADVIGGVSYDAILRKKEADLFRRKQAVEAAVRMIGERHAENAKREQNKAIIEKMRAEQRAAMALIPGPVNPLTGVPDPRPELPEIQVESTTTTNTNVVNIISPQLSPQLPSTIHIEDTNLILRPMAAAELVQDFASEFGKEAVDSVMEEANRIAKGEAPPAEPYPERHMTHTEVRPPVIHPTLGTVPDEEWPFSDLVGALNDMQQWCYSHFHPLDSKMSYALGQTIDLMLAMQATSKADELELKRMMLSVLNRCITVWSVPVELTKMQQVGVNKTSLLPAHLQQLQVDDFRHPNEGEQDALNLGLSDDELAAYAQAPAYQGVGTIGPANYITAAAQGITVSQGNFGAGGTGGQVQGTGPNMTPAQALAQGAAVAAQQAAFGQTLGIARSAVVDPFPEYDRDNVKPFDRTLRLANGHRYLLADGSEIHVDSVGNFEIKDQDAQITYKASRLREFNPFINSSDILATFIEDLGKLGATQEQAMHAPIEMFLRWLIHQAAKQDGEEAPADVPQITAAEIPAIQHPLTEAS